MATKKATPTKKAVVKKSVPEKVQEVRSNHLARLLLITSLILLAAWIMYSLY